MDPTILLTSREDSNQVEQVLSALVTHPAEQTERFEEDPIVQSYLQKAVVRQAEQLGLPWVRDSFGSVIIRVGNVDEPRGVALFTYAMTHPAGRMRDAHEPVAYTDEMGQRRMRGRGTSEQKAALAAALLAMARLRPHEKDLNGHAVLCVSPAGETGRHDTARVFMDASAGTSFDWCVLGIGTNTQICVANKGRIDATIRVRGQSAHSSTPWAGLNAIEGAREALQRLDGIELRGHHPQLGQPSLTATAIRSYPEATHTVPDEVRITIDRRLLPGDGPEPALHDIRQALDGMAPYEVDVVDGPFMYPSAVQEDSDLVRLLEHAVSATGHPKQPLRYSHGALDAGYFNDRGVPAVMFGPGDQAMWHTDEEAVAIDDVLLAASVYATAIITQLSRPAAS